MAKTTTDVVVVGGGIAGLTTAYRLARAGVDFRLIEAEPRWGGLIRTDRAGGFLLDAGPDSLLSQRPEPLALCDELGLRPHLVAAAPTPRSTYVVRRGRLHALPEGLALGVPTRFAPLARTPLFSWPGKLRMAMEAVIPRRRDDSDESIASFFRRRLGEEALELIGQPLLAGIHGGEASRLSMRCAFPALLDMEARHGSLIRAMWAASRAGGSRHATFFSLRDGLGELVDALLRRLPPRALAARTRVARVRRTADQAFELDLCGGSSLTARQVVLAAPMWETARLLVPAAPDVAVTLAPLRSVSSATVFLGFRRQDVGHPLDAHGVLVPHTEGLRTRACTFSSSKYPGRAPEGFVLLKGYLGTPRDPNPLLLDDAALIRAFREDMTPLLDLRGRPVLARTYRWPGASPQLEVGHEARHAAFERALARTPGLQVIGAGLRGSGVPNSIAEGLKAADRAIAHRGASEEAQSRPELVSCP